MSECCAASSTAALDFLFLHTIFATSLHTHTHTQNISDKPNNMITVLKLFSGCCVERCKILFDILVYIPYMVYLYVQNIYIASLNTWCWKKCCIQRLSCSLITRPNLFVYKIWCTYIRYTHVSSKWIYYLLRIYTKRES